MKTTWRDYSYYDPNAPDAEEPILTRSSSREQLVRTIIECHKALDALGVPSAVGQLCDDPECQSQLEHRVKHLLPLMFIARRT